MATKKRKTKYQPTLEHLWVWAGHAYNLIAQERRAAVATIERDSFDAAIAALEVPLEPTPAQLAARRALKIKISPSAHSERRVPAVVSETIPRNDDDAWQMLVRDRARAARAERQMFGASLRVTAEQLASVPLEELERAVVRVVVQRDHTKRLGARLAYAIRYLRAGDGAKAERALRIEPLADLVRRATRLKVPPIAQLRAVFVDGETELSLDDARLARK